MSKFYKKTSFLTAVRCICLILSINVCKGQGLPSKEQVAWANAEMGVIIHLDINIYEPTTFNYKDSKTLPDINVFKPSRLNTDQWVRTAKAAGAQYAVLTVKHGTGFCLWPSKVNNYNVAHTKWRHGKADILKEFIASCKKYGLKPGLYYNTNSNTYYNAGYKPFSSDSAHAAYNKAVLAQFSELWSNYGKVFEIWFDGGITTDKKNGIATQVLELIHDRQPQAILFQGPVSVKNIIRWVWDEDGVAAYPQWSNTNVTTSSNGLVKIEGLHGDPNGTIWCPAESDFPIRRNNAWNGGWLWRANQESYLFTVKALTEKYYKSIGRNTNMLIGMVVDTSGLIPKQDSLVFDSLGTNIRQLFSKPVATIKNFNKKLVEISLSEPQSVSQVVLEEDISKGENIRKYTLEALIGSKWQKIADGQSVGHKRIQTFGPVIADKVRFTINEAVKDVAIKKITFYKYRLRI